VATFGVFGTTAVLLVTDPGALTRARGIADAELAAVDLACSRFRPDSELSVLNANRGQLTRVSKLFAELIAEALRAAELTDGDVDPTVGGALVAAGYDQDFGAVLARRDDPPEPPAVLARGNDPQQPSRPAGAVPGWRSVRLDLARRHVRLDRGAQLDLGSTAKAWAADHCADLIAAELGCGVLVSLGGDIAVAGHPPDGGWQVKATDNHAALADATGQTVTIRSGGLATSSTTVRTWESDGKVMHHLINPGTGAPAVSCWRTVSVAAATCTDANIASTAAIIRGESALPWLSALALPARLVAHDGSVTTTAGWPGSCEGDKPGP
jgi:thiamine biosynthesis lipoprotein